jgi:hypothetical protein
MKLEDIVRQITPSGMDNLMIRNEDFLKLYKDNKFSRRRFEIIVSSLLFLIALLIFQDIVTKYQISKIGSIFVDVLFPVIGSVGIAIIIIVLSLISALMVIDKRVDELILTMLSKKNTPPKTDQDLGIQENNIEIIFEEIPKENTQTKEEKNTAKNIAIAKNTIIISHTTVFLGNFLTSCIFYNSFDGIGLPK